jgi:putative phosphoesterase
MIIYKIAVMSDVHANLPAIKSVLEDVQREKCHRIYHIGDAIGIGAFPKETLDLMLKEKIIMVMGNHEKYYLAKEPKFPENTSKGEIEHHQWVKSTLSSTYKKAVSAFPVLLHEQLNGLNLGFMHYVLDPKTTDSSDYKEVKKDLDENNIDSFFQLEGYDIIFYGHQHHPVFECRGADKGIHYVNPSALGCQTGSFASYCIVEISKKDYTITHKKVAYDKQAAVNALDIRNVPAKDYIKKVFYGAG